MKRITFALLLAMAALLQVHAVVINPIKVEAKENQTLADGEYAVSFNPLQARYVADGLKVTFSTYEVALYDATQVNNITVGDKVYCYGRLVDVNSVEKDEDYVVINPDEFEKGNNFFFNMSDDSRYYCIATNDCPNYDLVNATVSLVIPNDVKFMDYSQDPDEPVVIPCRRIKAKLSPEGGEIADVLITVKGGKLTAIERYYLP